MGLALTKLHLILHLFPRVSTVAIRKKTIVTKKLIGKRAVRIKAYVTTSHPEANLEHNQYQILALD
jgi:hypothetical protein